VDKKDNAQVEVIWSNKQSDVSNPAEGGETKLVPHGQALSAAKIILLTNPPVAGLVMNEKIMHFVCLHELGHALGIYGHSNKPGDILFTSLPLNCENVQLSPRDAATMLRLYNTPLGAAGDTGNTVHLGSLSDIDNANDIASFNERAVAAMNAANYTGAAAILKEAVSKYPQSGVLKRNYAAALNNTGLQAMQKQQYDRAIEIFNQSLSIAPSDKIAKTNIGVTHYNQGLILFRGNKATEAAVPLKQAAQILKEVGNTEVLTKVMNLLDVVQKQIDKQPKSSEPKSSEAPAAVPTETPKATRDDAGAAANDSKYIYPGASPYVHPGQAPHHSPAIDSYTNTDFGTDPTSSSSSSSTSTSSSSSTPSPSPAASPASTGNSTGSK
jgi:tetratricopeptide (TPR) repeat protein